MQLLDVVARGLVEEPLERRLVAGPAHAPQPVELAAVQSLDGAVGVGDLEVGVADGLNLGGLLGEEHCSAAGEGLDVGLVNWEHRRQAIGEALLAGGRAPDRLRDSDLEATHLFGVIVGGDQGDARTQPDALLGADARGVTPAADVEALEQLLVAA